MVKERKTPSRALMLPCQMKVSIIIGIFHGGPREVGRPPVVRENQVSGQIDCIFRAKKLSGLLRIHRRKSKRCQFQEPEASFRRALLVSGCPFRANFGSPPFRNLVRYAYAYHWRGITSWPLLGYSHNYGHIKEITQHSQKNQNIQILILRSSSKVKYTFLTIDIKCVFIT